MISFSTSIDTVVLSFDPDQQLKSVRTDMDSQTEKHHPHKPGGLHEVMQQFHDASRTSEDLLGENTVCPPFTFLLLQWQNVLS
jgi:hypothetical protein